MKIKSKDIEKSIEFVNRYGSLLVYPVKNDKDPRSLWSSLYPRSEMRWEWTDDSDNRVFYMWAMMKELSTCQKIVYSKWYQNRATFFSRELFTALIKKYSLGEQRLSPSACEILEVLESDSPLSTRQLKKMVDLQGKFHARTYDKSTKELFKKFLVVGFGEVDDGAFPSLALGATKTIYEDLWIEAEALNLSKAEKIIEKYIPADSKMGKFLMKSVGSLN